MDSAQLQALLQPILAYMLEAYEKINLALFDAGWVSLAAGILLCFFGVKIFSASVFWFGALFGGSTGYGIGSSFFDMPGGIVGAVVLGILCGYMLRAVVRIGFFLGGLLVGSLIGTSLLGQSPWVIVVIVASGITSVVFFNFFVMLSTSLWGAILLTGTFALYAPLRLDKYPYAITAIQYVLFFGGMFFQAGQIKKLDKRRQHQKEQ